MWTDYGGHMAWMWFGWIAGVGVLVLMVWAVARAAGGARGVDDSPETILKRRYARGEIDREEYERRLSDMRR